MISNGFIACNSCTTHANYATYIFALFGHLISASKWYSEVYSSNTVFCTIGYKCRVLTCPLNPLEKSTLILYATSNHKGWTPSTKYEYH